jgi:hypothetical protein
MLMTSRERAELLVAAVIGAALGGVTGYLLGYLVESGGWLKILIWALMVQPFSLAWFFVFGLFVRECFRPPLPAAVVSRRMGAPALSLKTGVGQYSFTAIVQCQICLIGINVGILKISYCDCNAWNGQFPSGPNSAMQFSCRTSV